MYAIQNLLKNSEGVEIELLVIVNGEDKRIIEYLSKIIESKLYLNLLSLGFVEDKEDLKELFTEAKG
jgi:hypothetical protein